MKTELRKITTMAILAALSIALVAMIHFPIFPAVAFLEYDPADIAILICGFSFGPVAGICVTIIAALIQGMTVSANSGVYGIIMHIIATSALVVTSSCIYKNRRTKSGAVLSLACGVLAMTAVMIPANLFITPIFMGVDRDVVVHVLPLIVLFNFIKAGVNAVITFLVYKKISNLIHRFN